MSIREQPPLPTEIMTDSISYLSYADQVSLLRVSRKFHDIALRFVFASIKIYFVGGQTFTEMFQSYPYFFMDMEKMAETMMRHSWEILEHIACHPSFATVVKTLSVIAYSDSPSVFERLCLGKALSALPDLKAFYWFGRQPELPYEVTDCLPLHLKSLSVQSTPPVSPLGPSRLHTKEIQRLQLETLFHTPPRMHSFDPDISFWSDLLVYPSNTATTLEILWSPQLRQLSLLSRHIDGISMLEFASLSELELCVAGNTDDSEFIGIDLIFHHTPMLESLSLVGYITSEIFLALPHDPTSLPNLKSFRLSAEACSLPQVSEEQVTVLSQFLNNHSSLRRLSLRLGAASWDTVSGLLPTFQNLTALEVLGLHAGHQCMMAEDFKVLASVISLRLTAIQLVIPWDYPDSVTVDGNALDPLVQRLQEVACLRFIHLYSIGRLLPLDPDDLANDLIHLDTIGCNRCLWDVRDQSLIQWKPWRVQYAIDEDFRCQDDAWLFKHL